MSLVEVVTRPARADKQVSDQDFGPDVESGGRNSDHFPAARYSKRRRRVVIVGGCITVAGVVLALFCLFAFVGSNIIGARRQQEVLSSFKKSLDAANSATATAGGFSPEAGEPMAIIRIPAIGLETIVVEGTRPTDLEAGPGHLRGSSLPGRSGNVVIAGRRTTFGAPFERLSDLSEGDKINIHTKRGAETYRVTKKKIVGKGDADVIGLTRANQLTLVTSNPRFLAKERLAVTAALQGEAPPPVVEAGPVVVAGGEVGLAGDNSALGPLVIWAELLIAVFTGAWFAYRRSPRRAIYLITTPIILAVLYSVFTQISRLLPGTL